jgi:L-asparaginase/Glu-tRNA(Gln) amidotransferase subunit D
LGVRLVVDKSKLVVVVVISQGYGAMTECQGVDGMGSQLLNKGIINGVGTRVRSGNNASYRHNAWV